MRHTEFWARMEEALGSSYAQYWASSHVTSDLEGRTPTEALAAGVPPKQVWAVVWRILELPERLR